MRIKKPTVTVYPECPHCKSELKIDVFKSRVGKPEPAEYDIRCDVKVEKQGLLFKGTRSAKKDPKARAAAKKKGAKAKTRQAAG